MFVWIVAILIFVSISLWKVASDRKMDLPNQMAGYTYAVYFTILGGVAFWNSGDLLRMSRMLFIGGVTLVALGLIGSKLSNEPQIEPRLRAFEKIFASKIVVLGIALTLTSGVLRLVLRSWPGSR